MVASDAVFARIAERLTKIDKNDRKVENVYKFILTDDSGAVIKTWILDLKQVKLYESQTADAECTLKLKESVMIDICDGKLDSMKALNDDLIDVDGNLELLYLLKPFLSSF